MTQINALIIPNVGKLYRVTDAFGVYAAATDIVRRNARGNWERDGSGVLHTDKTALVLDQINRSNTHSSFYRSLSKALKLHDYDADPMVVLIEEKMHLLPIHWFNYAMAPFMAFHYTEIKE